MLRQTSHHEWSSESSSANELNRLSEWQTAYQIGTCLLGRPLESNPGCQEC